MNRLVKSLIITPLIIVQILASSLCFAANRDVCSTCTYTNINDAFAAAQDGDTVRVAQGTYTGATFYSSKSLSLQGGYSSDFSTRDPNLYRSRISGGIIVSYFNTGLSAVIDGLEIIDGASGGIYAASSVTSVTVNNCIIHDNQGWGINISGANAVNITDNTIYSNIPASISYGISVRASIYTVNGPVTISGNSVYDQSCTYCAGIYFGIFNGADSVINNIVYNNYTGIYLSSTGASASPQVAYNTVYGNSEYGIYISNASFQLHHNLVRNNTKRGVYLYNPHNSVIQNNTIARNGSTGMLIIGANGAPAIRNNIFWGNNDGLYISSNDAGWGTTAIRPAPLANNAFDENVIGDFVHSSLEPAYSYHSEETSAWDSINQFGWASENIVEAPHFADADGGDYNLAPNSFLIDEGDVDTDYSSEPAPNGNRVNLGAYGASSNAESSPNEVAISNLSVSVSGSDIVTHFDTNSDTASLWVVQELWNGSSYQAIPAAALAGSNARIGYNGVARIDSGSGRTLTWSSALDSISELAGQTLHIRTTLSHGNSSVQAISSGFSFSAPTPTPTASATPTPTVPPTPNPEPTQTPVATATGTPTAIETSTPSPIPTASNHAQILFNVSKYGLIKFSPSGEACGKGCRRFRLTQNRTSLRVSLVAVPKLGASLVSMQGCSSRTPRKDSCTVVLTNSTQRKIKIRFTK